MDRDVTHRPTDIMKLMLCYAFVPSIPVARGVRCCPLVCWSRSRSGKPWWKVFMLVQTLSSNQGGPGSVFVDRGHNDLMSSHEEDISGRLPPCLQRKQLSQICIRSLQYGAIYVSVTFLLFYPCLDIRNYSCIPKCSSWALGTIF